MIAMMIGKITTEGRNQSNPSLRTIGTKLNQTMFRRNKEGITDHNIGKKSQNMTPSPTDSKEHTIKQKLMTEATKDETNPIKETINGNKDQYLSHVSIPITQEKDNKKIGATTKTIDNNSGLKITTFRRSFLHTNKSKITSMSEKRLISKACTLS